MPLRINLITQVDVKTAERLAQEAKECKMRMSPYLRAVLDAHAARQEKAQPTANGPKPQ